MEVKNMNSKPVVVGLCVGVATGIGTGMIMAKPKKHNGKNMVGKTLRAMGDMADSVSSAMGYR
jgi:gas vesicle protein